MMKVVKNMVRSAIHHFNIKYNANACKQMACYYATPPTVNIVPNVSDEEDAATETVLEFNKHCETLLANNTEEGWASELRHIKNLNPK